jgi:hypothetical protein
VDPKVHLWQTWAPLIGGLSAELVGTVPETAYIPAQPGHPTRHEVGEPIQLEPSYFDDDKPDLDSGSNIAEQGPIPSPALTSTPSVELHAGPESIPAIPAGPAHPIAGSVSPDARNGAQNLQQDLNTTPPSTRQISTNAKLDTIHPIRPVIGVARTSRCANCRTAVLESKDWRRCPDCHLQLCTHCIVEALLFYEEGWCTHCAGLRHLNILSRDLGPAGRRTRVRNSHIAPPPKALPKAPTKSPVPAPSVEWKEPEWFVKISELRNAARSVRSPTARPRHSHLESGSSPGRRGPNSRPAPNPRRLSFPAARI